MNLTTGSIAKGTIIVGGSGLGIYGITELVDLGGDNTIKYLFESKDFGEPGSKYSSSGNTFGYAFGKFLLDPNENSWIWSKKEKEAKKDTYISSKEFEAVKKTGSDYKTVKQICEEIYSKQKSDLDELSNPSKPEYKLSLDTWMYCTVLKNRPRTVIQETDSYTNKWARESDNAKALLSVKGENDNNDDDLIVWHHVFRDLKKNLEDIRQKDMIDEKFAEVVDAKALMKVCEDSYNSSSTDDADGNYGHNARKYCVLDASIVLSKYPTKP